MRDVARRALRFITLISSARAPVVYGSNKLDFSVAANSMYLPLF